MKWKLLAIAACALGVIFLLGTLSDTPAPQWTKPQQPATGPALAPHEVVVNKRIGLTTENRRKITIDVPSEITREQCLALLAHYGAFVGERGQVGVRKPAPPDGKLVSWCVDNVDGTPIIWHDQMFDEKIFGKMR